jgi:hypothetical protein
VAAPDLRALRDERSTVTMFYRFRLKPLTRRRAPTPEAVSVAES